MPTMPQMPGTPGMLPRFAPSMRQTTPTVSTIRPTPGVNEPIWPGSKQLFGQGLSQALAGPQALPGATPWDMSVAQASSVTGLLHMMNLVTTMGPGGIENATPDQIRSAYPTPEEVQGVAPALSVEAIQAAQAHQLGWRPPEGGGATQTPVSEWIVNPQEHPEMVGQVNPWKVGSLQWGTRGWPGGWAMIGERGPELMKLPQGTQVMPWGTMGSPEYWRRNPAPY